jgi:hypothetical protein
MWTIDTPWFDVAVVMTIFAVGSILFGRFEEHKPRGRRLAKVVIVLVVTLVVRQIAGRVYAYALLSLPLAGAAWLHLVWLPRHGVSGWTAEPRARYLELVTQRRRHRAPRHHALDTQVEPVTHCDN